jgi:hypothetical protein
MIYLLMRGGCWSQTLLLHLDLSLPLCPVVICFMKLGAPTFSAYIFRIIISSWYIVSFIHM